MTHDGNYRRATLLRLFVVVRTFDAYFHIRFRNALQFVPEFGDHELGRVRVDGLRRRHHDIHTHQRLDNVGGTRRHAVSQFLNCDHLGHDDFANDGLSLNAGLLAFLTFAFKFAFVLRDAALALFLFLQSFGDRQLAWAALWLATARRRPAFTAGLLLATIAGILRFGLFLATSAGSGFRHLLDRGYDLGDGIGHCFSFFGRGDGLLRSLNFDLRCDFGFCRGLHGLAPGRIAFRRFLAFIFVFLGFLKGALTRGLLLFSQGPRRLFLVNGRRQWGGRFDGNILDNLLEGFRSLPRLHLGHTAARIERKGPLRLPLHLHHLRTAMGKVLAHGAGLNGLLQLQLAGSGQAQL